VIARRSLAARVYVPRTWIYLCHLLDVKSSGALGRRFLVLTEPICYNIGGLLRQPGSSRLV
jgi:hypothetical protein